MPEEEHIRLDPAVEAAMRVIKTMNERTLELPMEFNDDVVTMAVLILRLAGYQISDKTGEGHPNTKPG